MRTLLLVLVCGLLSLAPAAQAAGCDSAGSRAARVIGPGPPDWVGKHLIPLSLWLGMLSKNGFPDLAKLEQQCQRTAFNAAHTRYVLRGENDDPSAPRVATPANRSAPIAYLVTEPDLVAALKANDGKPPPILGYALVTSQAGAYTIFRTYDAIPTDRALAREMAAALDGRLKPTMRSQSGQNQIFVGP